MAEYRERVQKEIVDRYAGLTAEKLASQQMFELQCIRALLTGLVFSALTHGADAGTVIGQRMQKTVDLAERKSLESRYRPYAELSLMLHGIYETFGLHAPEPEAEGKPDGAV